MTNGHAKDSKVLRTLAIAKEHIQAALAMGGTPEPDLAARCAAIERRLDLLEREARKTRRARS